MKSDGEKWMILQVLGVFDVIKNKEEKEEDKSHR